MDFRRQLGWVAVAVCAACGGNSTPLANAPGLPASGAGSTPAATTTSGTSGVAGTSGGAGRAPGTTSPATVAAGGGGSGAKTNGAAGTGGSAGHAATDDSDAGVSSAGAGSVAPRSTGPGDWMAGDYPDALDSGNWIEISGVPGQMNMTRQYRVHVPPQYDPKTPMPLLFCIHGLGQDGILFCVDGASMPTKSDAAGFLLVIPNGYSNSWNAGTCCGDAVTQGLDDVALFRAIFAEVGKHLNIDLTRVYATGLSNGGYMSYRLACEASDLFVAVAPGAGAIGMADIGGGTSMTSDIKACTPTTPVSVLDIHGTDDPLIPFSTQKPSLDRIAMGDSCQGMTHPATQPASVGDVTCVSYDGCPTGVDVTGCSVKGGGHVWFGSPNCGTGVDAACSIVGNNSNDIMDTDAVWAFFSAHSRP